MVVDHSASLHRRVSRHRPGEPESALAQFSRQRLGCRSPGRHIVQRLRRRALITRVTPDGLGQTLRQIERGPGVVDGRIDLGAVAYDPGVCEQPRNVVRAECGDGGDVEAIECGAEVLPLTQDRQPGQPGLERLEADSLEHPGVVADWLAPLFIVIADVFGRSQGPRAAQLPIRASRRPSHGWPPTGSGLATLSAKPSGPSPIAVPPLALLPSATVPSAPLPSTPAPPSGPSGGAS